MKPPWRDGRASRPRRILYLHTTSEIGGSDVSLARIVEGLDRSRFQSVVALPSHGPLVARLEAAGCAVRIVPRMRKLTSRRGATFPIVFALNYPIAIARLAHLVRTEHVDLLHANTLHNPYGVGVALVTRKPLVWHAREIVWQSALVRRGEIALTRLADRVVVTSEAVEAMFIDGRGRCPSNVRRVPNGVDVRTFRPGAIAAAIRAELDLPIDDPLVGVVCRLDPWKGVDVFLHAAAEVSRSLRSARFVVVGGPIVGQEGHARALPELASSLGLGDAVRFAGWRYEPDDMPALFRALNVLVLPSKRPEPFGLVLLEAMASGIPVVATDHGGPREICVPGETGLLVPPGDPGALATAIRELLESPERARAMGAAGRRRVEASYDQRQTVERLMLLYDEVLSG